MRYKKLILITATGLIAVAGIYAYKEYNRKQANLSAVLPQYTISATALVDSFEKDGPKANSNFTGKIILVTGMITEVNNQDTLLNIYLGNEDALHKVSCMIDIKNNSNKLPLEVGKNIAVKGICTGYLADVEMNSCVIVNNK